MRLCSVPIIVWCTLFGVLGPPIADCWENEELTNHGRREVTVKATILAAACALLTPASMSQAAEITFGGGDGLAGGGVFNWSGDLGNFQSFCVELNEFLTGNPYQATINYNEITGETSAVGGGRFGQVGGADPLSEATARLYAEFVGSNDGLAALSSSLGYNFADATDRNSAVQLAIWVMEQEAVIVGDTVRRSSTVDGSATSSQLDYSASTVGIASIIDLAEALISGAQAGDFGNNWRNVRVLNLTNAGGNAQDMLYLVPLPQAGALAALGLAGVAVRRRRA
jgi:hypothetical protein